MDGKLHVGDVKISRAGRPRSFRAGDVRCPIAILPRHSARIGWEHCALFRNLSFMTAEHFPKTYFDRALGIGAAPPPEPLRVARKGTKKFAFNGALTFEVAVYFLLWLGGAGGGGLAWGTMIGLWTPLD